MLLVQQLLLGSVKNACHSGSASPLNVLSASVSQYSSHKSMNTSDHVLAATVSFIYTYDGSGLIRLCFCVLSLSDHKMLECSVFCAQSIW